MSRNAGIFKSTRMSRNKRSKFQMNHTVSQSQRIGELVPFFCKEVTPGDTVKVGSDVLARFAPMISPVFHNVDVKTEFFFVPNYLIWEEWDKFITGGKTGLEEPVMPFIRINESRRQYVREGSLMNYLGVPAVPSGVTIVGDHLLNSLPLRAYLKIWIDYYQEDRLSTTEVDTFSGEETSLFNLTTLRTRRYEKDYFTSCQTETQLGSEMEIPIGSFSPQYADVGLPVDNTGTGTSGDVVGSNPDLLIGGSPGNIQNLENPQIIDGAQTVNDLRIAVKLQQLKELMMRVGSRYYEQILGIFGVKPDDRRLDRCVFLGGGKQPVVISEVLNTSDTANAVQGEMSGHAVSAGQGHGFSYNFNEHGFVIGIVSVVPKPGYQQGLPKMFFRNDKYDFLWPSLGNLGEQPVYNKELYYDWNDSSENDDEFGYQSRYADYKYMPSRVAGEMCSSLSHWTMNRIFENRPQLNLTFLGVDSADFERVFAVQDEDVDNVYIQIYNRVDVLTQLPYYGIPSL